MGVFSENFTMDGLLEDSVHLGDRFSVGSAEVFVTQPRLPCYKLGVRFQSDEMVKRFFASRRTGFYLAVRRLIMEIPAVPVASRPARTR